MKKILVIDDAGFFLRTMIVTLRDYFEVDVANTAMLANGKIAKNRPDLILLDYNMPDVTGVEYLERLRANPDTKDIPVFFLTGTDDAKSVVDILKQKPSGYLLKSTPKEKLLETLLEFFKKHAE